MKKILIFCLFVLNITYAKYPIYMLYDGFVMYFNPFEDDTTICLENIVNGVDEGYCGEGELNIELRLFDEDYRTDGACTLLVYKDALDFEWKLNMKHLRAGTLIGYAKTIEKAIPDIHRYKCPRKEAQIVEN